MKAVRLVLPVFVLFLFSCTGNKQQKQELKKTLTATIPVRVDESVPQRPDTVQINGSLYTITIGGNDTTAYFKVEKQVHGKFKTILIDDDYTTNNSDLFFKDENNDGYPDVVWTKKWQDHA